MILLLFLLLLVPSAWAGEPRVTRCIGPAQSPEWHKANPGWSNCLMKTEETVNNIDEGCIAKMEAAMRAMAPYINNYDSVTGITYSSIYKGAPNDVMKLWGDAKACWRTQ